MFCYSTAKVKHHLDNYFDKSREALVGGVEVDQELCLLCTHCFEVINPRRACAGGLL